MTATAKELEARAAELREVADAPTEREAAAAELAEVEARIAEQEEAAARAEAESRMKAIARARGSLVAEFARDAERVREAAGALAGAIARINDRFDRILSLELEAADLAADRGVRPPELPRVPPPAEAVSAKPGVALSDEVHERKRRAAHRAAREKPRRAAEEEARRRRCAEEYERSRFSELPRIARTGDQPIAGSRL